MNDNPQQPPAPVFQFLPLTIRLETLGGIATPLVYRGTPLPTKRTETFGTASDDQHTVEVHILMGESSLSSRCRSIGKFKLSGLPSAPRGQQEVRISFEVKATCEIHVHAVLIGSPLHAEEVLIPKRALLRPEAISKHLAQTNEFQQEDEVTIKLIEARNSAHKAISEAENYLSSVNESGRRDTVNKAIAEVGQALASDNVEEMNKSVRSLKTALTPLSFDLSGLFGTSNMFSTHGRTSPADTHDRKVHQDKSTSATVAAAGLKTEKKKITSLETESLEIFISHSSNDSDIAESLVNLLRAALDVPVKKIRCTSVDGYRHAIGAVTEEQLRQEVNSSKVFIGLLTPSAIESAYVLFELGARWGASLHMAPLLAAGANASYLRGPLKALNALCCDEPAQLHQFIENIAEILKRTKNSAAAYQKQLDVLCQRSKAKMGPVNA